MTQADILVLLRKVPITPDRYPKLQGVCARTGVGLEHVLKALTDEERAALMGQS